MVTWFKSTVMGGCGEGGKNRELEMEGRWQEFVVMALTAKKEVEKNKHRVWICMWIHSL